MNRQQRRAAAAAERQRSPTSDCLAADLRALHADAGGALKVYLVGEADALALVLDAVEGAKIARALIRAAESLTLKVSMAGHERLLCLAWPAELTTMRRVRVGLATLSRADLSTAMALALCVRCATAGDVDDRVLSGLRSNWPRGWRVVVTHREGGHA